MWVTVAAYQLFYIEIIVYQSVFINVFPGKCRKYPSVVVATTVTECSSSKFDYLIKISVFDRVNKRYFGAGTAVFSVYTRERFLRAINYLKNVIFKIYNHIIQNNIFLCFIINVL